MKIDAQVDSIKIVENSLTLQKKIKEAISKKYNGSKLEKNVKLLNEELAKFFYIKFLESDTFYALTEGDLRGEFGFSDSYLNNIEEVCRQIAAVYMSVEQDTSKKFIRINIGVSDNDDIDLNDIGAYSTEDGVKIYWLYWLLTQGTNVVVPDHNVKFIQGAGRSHMAIMVQDDYVSYSVDEQFAGVDGDNWITRTINKNKNEFLNIIKRHINGT